MGEDIFLNSTKTVNGIKIKMLQITTGLVDSWVFSHGKKEIMIV